MENPPQKMSENANPMEDKWSRCKLDTAMKGTGGTLLGGLGSLLIFRRRLWPVLLGSGLGVGMAYKNCEDDINKVINKDDDGRSCLCPKDEKCDPKREIVKPKKENGEHKKENGEHKKENGEPKKENGVPKKENGVPKKENGEPKVIKL